MKKKTDNRRHTDTALQMLARGSILLRFVPSLAPISAFFAIQDQVSVQNHIQRTKKGLNKWAKPSCLSATSEETFERQSSIRDLIRVSLTNQDTRR